MCLIFPFRTSVLWRDKDKCRWCSDAVLSLRGQVHHGRLQPAEEHPAGPAGSAAQPPWQPGQGQASPETLPHWRALQALGSQQWRAPQQLWTGSGRFTVQLEWNYEVDFHSKCELNVTQQHSGGNGHLYLSSQQQVQEENPTQSVSLSLHLPGVSIVSNIWSSSPNKKHGSFPAPSILLKIDNNPCSANWHLLKYFQLAGLGRINLDFLGACKLGSNLSILLPAFWTVH